MALDEFLYGLRSFKQRSEQSSFRDLPLIDNLRQELVKSKTNKKGKSSVFSVGKNNNRKRSKPEKSLIPLAAYTCHSEKPIIVGNSCADTNAINILNKTTLMLIGTLGHNSLRPIGIDKTLKELEDSDTHERDQPAGPRNGDHISGSVQRHNVYQQSSSFIIQGDHSHLHNVLANDAGDPSEEEADQSYDYDAYEQENESMVERVRETYVENSQLIDASYVQRSRRADDAPPLMHENDDSGHESPSLTISEAVEAGAQGSRISSLTERLTAAMNEEL